MLRAQYHFVAAVIAVFVLSACDSGGSTRSPDLPPTTLNSMAVNCTPTTIAAGLTGQCTASCTYRVVNSDGSVTITQPGACDGLNWNSDDPNIVSIDGDGEFTGENPGGPVNVGGCVEDACDSVPVTVTGALPTSLQIIPDAQNLVVGTRSQYIARATFTDGGQADVAAQPGMNWSIPAQNNIAICNTNGGCGAGNGKGSVSGLQVGGPITVTGSFTSGGTTVTDTATVTVVDATLINGGLCVEPIPVNAQPGDPRLEFSGCRADSGGCSVTQVSIPVSGTQQFRARGRFNNGQECSLTQTASWSSGNTNFFTVNDTTSKGLATGVAPGNSNVRATFSGQTGQHPLTVFNQLMLGNNSLEVGVPIDSDMDGDIDPNDALGKFFCIGYADLVGGLENSPDLPGAQQLQANARFCAQNQIMNGACTAPFTPALGTQAVNARIPSNWEVQEGFWNGTECESIAGDPTGMNVPPAQVGNTFTVTPPVDNKGLVTPRGSVRLGTACVRATYTNPFNAANSDFDGATALVLPITNDVVLQDDEVDDAVELCNTLAPLFLLAGNDNGGAGAVTQLLSAVSEILNPVLTGLTQGNEPGGPIPTNDVVDALIGGLSDNLTAMLFEAGLQDVVDGVNDGVYAPLNCGLGALLNGLLTQDPSVAEQALASCPPSGVPGLPGGGGLPSDIPPGGLPGGGGGGPIDVGGLGLLVLDPENQCGTLAGQGGCVSDLPVP